MPDAEPTVRERLQAILRGEDVTSNAASALATIDALPLHRTAKHAWRVLPDDDPARLQAWAEQWPDPPAQAECEQYTGCKAPVHNLTCPRYNW